MRVVRLTNCNDAANSGFEVTRASSESGRTLLEMVVTIAIIGIIASVATPSSDTVRHQELTLAASVTADALRYAREQARLTGNFHGVELDLDRQQLSVFRLDRDVSPPEKIFDVMHPLAKQAYVLDFNRPPYKMIALSSTRSKTIGACTASDSFVFDPHGVVRCIDPVTSRYSGQSIQYESDGMIQSVAIDGYTGRVTVP